jgi:replicative DNA helicase
MRQTAKVIPMEIPAAEQSVLGAILVRPEVLDELVGQLNPDDFYREAHGRIYRAMVDLAGRGAPVDLVSVSALLHERGQLEGVGGPVFLASLSKQVGFATNAAYYAGLVHDKSILRQLEARARKILDKCQKPVNDTTVLLQWAESLISEVTGANGHNKPQPVISAQTMLARTYTKETQIIGNGVLPAGGGLILAGESGEGKSLIRTQLALHLAMGWDIWELPIPTARRIFIFTFEKS